MELSPADIKLIVDTLAESDYDQAEVVIGDVRIAVGRGDAPLPSGAVTPAAANTPAAVVATPAPAAPAAPVAAPVPTAPAPAPEAPAGHVVTSPTVGVFWRAPEPGAAPFVEVGSAVAVGDTLGIVEVMKLMSNITADVAGTVTAIHVANAEGVEHGTALVSIDPVG